MKQTVFLSSLLKERLPEFTLGFQETLNSHNIPVTFLELTNDIWIRDFLPIQVGENRFVQFSLTKDYYPKKLNHLRTDPLPISEKFGLFTVPPVYNRIPIYIDGGNIIRKFNKVILTDKIFKDNRHIPQKELMRILKDYMRVEQIIIIPREPGEDSGHSDGMVRFVNKDTVLVNDYSSVNTNQRFVKDLYRSITDSGLSIIKVPYKPVDGRINGFQPSTGVYINFLQVKGIIFLPTFDDPFTDDRSISMFKEIFGSGNVIPIPSRELSLLGGVLNCCSWEIMDS